MKGRGNKPLKKREDLVVPEKLNCAHCNYEYDSDHFYDSDSEFYRSTGKIPYCRQCLNDFYCDYLKKYKTAGYFEPERKAIERLCMVLDVYYNDDVFDAASRDSEKKTDASMISLYLKQTKLYQYRNKNYETTIDNKYKEMKNSEVVMTIHTKQDEKQSKNIKAAAKLFGHGFTNDDYMFLYEQYMDWTTRHECETKSQEEVFKQICFTQLELLKATRAKQDTKDLNMTFLKQLEAAKLQPKQNKGGIVAEGQTFGTLIDKWENTKPLPEIDDDLKDVDKIAWYINVFFKGHLAKMMGLKSGLSNMYSEFMKKYTVEKPEYDGDENNEALFDAIFGNQEEY